VAAQGQKKVDGLATARADETTNTALVETTTLADGSLAPESSKSAAGKTKKKGKPKLTPKERKERSVRVFLPPPFPPLLSCLCLPRFAMKMAIDKVISSLPLEFRGNDPVSNWVFFLET